jgi:hypothetical protein
MKIEQDELIAQLQGQWKIFTGMQTIEFKGRELTVYTDAKSVTTSFELKQNLQLRKWQIKVLEPVSWLRTFIVDITPDEFVLYDFDLGVNIAMAQRARLTNPSRVYKYARVAVEAAT